MKVFAVLLTVAFVGLSSAGILQPADYSSVISGKYIVKLKNCVDSKTFVASKSLRSNDGFVSPLKDNVQHVYNSSFNGFSGSFDDTQLRALDAMQEVDYIEADGIAKTQGQVQTGAAWGLARTSSRNSLSGSHYNFYYKSSSGTGATVYVIDTGVNTKHVDFQDRASFGYSSVTGESNDDLNGHGTHVAGTIAGHTYGIAKGAKIVAVKVLNRDGVGSWSGVMAGIEWVTANASPTRAVISMPLGGGASASVDDAIARAVERGFTTVVAAGNSNANACHYSPARTATTITVAASDVNDRYAEFSNYGGCVKGFAPGVSVLSAWIGSTTATNTLSGTSMASAHVAGLAAYMISEHGLKTPQAVGDKISELETSGALSSVPSGTPNKLIYNSGNGVN